MNGPGSGDDGRDGRSLPDGALGSDRSRPPGRLPQVGGAGASGMSQPGQAPDSGGGDMPPDSMELSPIFRSWSDPSSSADPPERCHFLRTIKPDGKLGEPLKEPALTHRCAAFGEPLPLSLRQQELVCLQKVHVSCPRYLRGALLANESAPEPEVIADGGGFSRITAIGLLLLGVAFLLGALILTGTLKTPGSGNGSSHSNVAVVTASPTPTESPTDSPTPVASPSRTVSASPTATASSSPTATARPTPTPTPSATPTLAPTPSPTPGWTPNPSPTWPPGATASRMDLLTPCSDRPNCYVYVVRGPGTPAGPYPSGNGSKVADKLDGLCRFFGVSVSKVREMNSFLSTRSIKPGDHLRIPTPTR